MKIISPILFFLFLAPLSWGSESLFGFLHDHKLGSKVSAGDEGFAELPDVKILGQQLSAYHELNSDKSVRRVGLYLRSNGTDISEDVLEDVFNQIRRTIVSQTGEAEAIDVPNAAEWQVREAWRTAHGFLCARLWLHVVALQKRSVHKALLQDQESKDESLISARTVTSYA